MTTCNNCTHSTAFGVEILEHSHYTEMQHSLLSSDCNEGDCAAHATAIGARGFVGGRLVQLLQRVLDSYPPVCERLSPNVQKKKNTLSTVLCAARSALSWLAVTVIVIAVYTMTLHTKKIATGPANDMNFIK